MRQGNDVFGLREQLKQKSLSLFVEDESKIALEVSVPAGNKCIYLVLGVYIFGYYPPRIGKCGQIVG